MAQTSEVKKLILKASPKNVLPVFYCGKIIHIDSKKTTELDEKLLRYETKIQIEKALKEKSIFEIKGDKK